MLHQSSMLFASMAYLTYIGNWLSLTVALRVSSKQGGNWQMHFLFWFKPFLYTFICFFSIFTLGTTMVFCQQIIPTTISIIIEVTQTIVVGLAVGTCPFILIMLKKCSHYLYEKTRCKVRWVYSSLLKIDLYIVSDRNYVALTQYGCQYIEVHKPRVLCVAY